MEHVPEGGMQTCLLMSKRVDSQFDNWFALSAVQTWAWQVTHSIDTLSIGQRTKFALFLSKHYTPSVRQHLFNRDWVTNVVDELEDAIKQGLLIYIGTVRLSPGALNSTHAV